MSMKLRRLRRKILFLLTNADAYKDYEGKIRPMTAYYVKKQGTDGSLLIFF